MNIKNLSVIGKNLKEVFLDENSTQNPDPCSLRHYARLRHRRRDPGLSDGQRNGQNTFTVGNVTITMDETNVDNDPEGVDRDTANTYKLIPGETYKKDPIIHVGADSEDCYVFVKVENQIKNVEGEGENGTIEGQMTTKYGWQKLDGADNVYYKADAVKGGSNVNVFDDFTVRADAEASDLAEVNNQTIVVTAYAIQADGFESAQEAWNAAGDDFNA